MEDHARSTGAPALIGDVRNSDLRRHADACAEVRTLHRLPRPRISMADCLTEHDATLTDRFLAPDAAVSKRGKGGLEPRRLREQGDWAEHRGRGGAAAVGLQKWKRC